VTYITNVCLILNAAGQVSVMIDTASDLMVHLVAGLFMKCLETVYNDNSVECAAGMCISQT